MRGYQRRLRIWEANYGRDAGWEIEHRGQVIATLTDPRWEDLFWVSYRMEIATDDPSLRQRLHTPEFWGAAESEGLVWRSREFDAAAECAFPALTPFVDPDRLIMRGLYLLIGEPWPWDRMVLWFRRFFRRAA